MSSHIGTKLHMSVFGESHGEGVGVILDGFPAGFAVDQDKLLAFQDRRRPGKNLTSTQRQEPDLPVILGGITNGVTNGAPIAMMIKNQDTRSKDYAEMLTAARPGHADYTGFVRYQGANDPRVKQAESDQIVKAMQDKKIPVTYVLFPDEGHGFARPENSKAFFAVTEGFLAQCLGGRAQPIGEDFAGSSISVPAGADGVPGLAEALKSHTAAVKN